MANRFLTWSAYGLVLFFMGWAGYNALTSGIFSYMDYIPFLPKGTRIFQGFSYSILIFGTLALYAIKRYGWTGLFAVVFLNELWEFLYDLTPAVATTPACTSPPCGPGYWGAGVSHLYQPHYPLYLLMAILIGGTALAIAFRFKGNVLNWKRVLGFSTAFWVFCMFTDPWTVQSELIGELLFFGLIFASQVFQKPRITFELGRHFDNQYFDKQKFQDYQNDYFELAKWISVNLKPTKALDVGSGKGFLVAKIANQGIEAWGIDNNAYAVKNRVTATIESAEADNLPFGSQQFDLVVSIGTLQFVKDKQAVLREIRRVLKPGGHVFLSCEWPKHDIQMLLFICQKVGLTYDRELSQKDQKFLRRLIVGRKFGIWSYAPLRWAVRTFFGQNFFIGVFE